MDQLKMQGGDSKDTGLRVKTTAIESLKSVTASFPLPEPPCESAQFRFGESQGRGLLSCSISQTSLNLFFFRSAESHNLTRGIDEGGAGSPTAFG